MSAGSDGSLGDFSMENYTADLAQLSRVGVDGESTTRESRAMDNAQGGIPEKEADVGSASDGDPGDILGDFTIDMGGLGNQPSSVVVEDRDIDREEVPSKDEGPEDFTVNLEKWMRGGDDWRKPTNEEDLDRDYQDNDIYVHEEGLPDEHVAGIDEESLLEPVGTSTPASQERHDVDYEDLRVQMVTQVPALTRSNTQVQNQAAEEVFERISALQAEVEKMRVEDGFRREAHAELEQENIRLRNQKEDLSNALQQPSLKTPHTDNEALKSLEFQLLSAQSTVSALEADLKSNRTHHETQVRGIERELQEQKAIAETERQKCLTLAHEAAKLAESRQQNERTIQQMTETIENMETELGGTRDQLRETRRLVMDIEDENNRIVQDNQRQAQDLTVKSQQSQRKNEELQAAHARITELQSGAAAIEGTEALHNVKELLLQTHEATLSALREKHLTEMDTLRTALQKASQGMQKREASLKKSHNEKVFTLQQTISTLQQQSKAQIKPPTPSLEEKLRSAIRVLSNKLEKANVATQAAHAQAENAQRDADAANERADLVKQANELVNAELEARFADAVDAREREWMRRANMLFRDRDKMSRALLHCWGREEVGIAGKGERQAYRYRYVKRGP